MSQKQHWINTIKKGVELLKNEKAYNQAFIIKKIKYLDPSLMVSTPSLSNMLKDRGAGLEALRHMASGIALLIKAEFGMVYDTSECRFVPLTDNESVKQNLAQSFADEIITDNYHFKYHKHGRLPIGEKVKFISKAQKDIIEFGIRLKTFSQYFTSRNQHEFRIPVEKLLQRGVNMQVYLLDPASSESEMYFKDRAKAQSDERHAVEETQRAIEQLLKVKANFEANHYTGQFEIFSYQHIPYNHFLVTDGDTDAGRMLISHYIYGVNRADCPVIEFSKFAEPDLYQLYWQSLQSLISNAKKLI